MPRPIRNRVVLLLCLAGAALIGAVVPRSVALALLATVFTLAFISYLVSFNYFSARRAMRKKKWVEALKGLEAYELGLATPWKRWLSFLALGTYSLDGVAIARNNVGVVHLENAKLEWAEKAFASALERDPLYAVPHVNLAVAAARRGDGTLMQRHLDEAARLGVRSSRMNKRIAALLPASK